MKYKRIEQPEDSWNSNPCWDCVFGKEDGECHAPKEILELDEECGFDWRSPNYVYVEDTQEENEK